MNRYIKFYFICATAILLSACSRKVIDLSPNKIDRKKTAELISNLDYLSRLKPNTFYSKFNTRFKDTSQTVSFKTSIRMIKDSATSAIITFANFPIFNALLTTDSLSVVNKRKKCFSKTKLSFLKDNLGYAFDYSNVEELILGLPIAYDTNQRYYQIHDPSSYIISSHRKRDLKKNDKGKSEKMNNTDEIIIKYYLNEDATTLKRMDIESADDSVRVQIDYFKREIVNLYNIPKEVFVQVFTPQNTIQVNLEYEKTEINKPQTLFLVIPENYEACE
jgi:hypothetical protein